jgi:hypothetical protein
MKITLTWVLSSLFKIPSQFARFHVNFGFSGPVILEKMLKILKYFSYINAFKHSPPYSGHTRPPGAMLLTNLLLYYIRNLSCKGAGPRRVKIGPIKWAKLN